MDMTEAPTTCPSSSASASQNHEETDLDLDEVKSSAGSSVTATSDKGKDKPFDREAEILKARRAWQKGTEKLESEFQTLLTDAESDLREAASLPGSYTHHVEGCTELLKNRLFWVEC